MFTFRLFGCRCFSFSEAKRLHVSISRHAGLRGGWSRRGRRVGATEKEGRVKEEGGDCHTERKDQERQRATRSQSTQRCLHPAQTDTRSSCTALSRAHLSSSRRKTRKHLEEYRESPLCIATLFFFLFLLYVYFFIVLVEKVPRL